MRIPPPQMTVLFALICAAVSPAALANAEKLRDLEVDCWHKSIEGGAFFCNYVTIQGKRASDGKRLVPELHAPDQGGAGTRTQAARACRAMGFDTAKSFELETAAREVTRVVIGASLREGDLVLGHGAFIQHLVCE